jgi:hypothetical protein
MNEIPLGDESVRKKIFDSNIYRYEDNTYKDIYRIHPFWNGYVRILQKL